MNFSVLKNCVVGALCFAASATPAIAVIDGCYTPETVPPGTITYATNYKVTPPKGSCPVTTANLQSGLYHYRQTMSENPGPAMVSCFAINNNQVICEAYPEGNTLTYAWTATHNFSQPGGAATPNILIQCNGNSGTAYVTVRAPNGQTATASSPYTCSAPE